MADNNDVIHAMTNSVWYRLFIPLPLFTLEHA